MYDMNDDMNWGLCKYNYIVYLSNSVLKASHNLVVE